MLYYTILLYVDIVRLEPNAVASHTPRTKNDWRCVALSKPDATYERVRQVAHYRVALVCMCYYSCISAGGLTTRSFCWQCAAFYECSL
jgi:hypothetical protein